MKKYKRRNNDVQNTTQNIKARATRTPLKTGVNIFMQMQMQIKRHTCLKVDTINLQECGTIETTKLLCFNRYCSRRHNKNFNSAKGQSEAINRK
jgi:hypothetical protein